MTIAHEAPKASSRSSQLLTTDFCPWANRFVYWLKEPIGWCVLATVASVLVGMFLSPLGWTIAAGLTAVLVFGMGFPWLATRCVSCRLHPACGELHERETSYLQLSIRNYLPLPIMGLMVEGYLSTSAAKAETESLSDTSDAALERIPALSIATYRLSISAEYRGQYPKRVPKITCAFPFGIWTARREIRDWSPVTVLPLLIPISEELEFTGDQFADFGVGNRASTHGDFLGVRDFRRGDALKNIHWAHSARHDQFVVCERGGPQNQAIELYLSTARCQGSNVESRENFAVSPKAEKLVRRRAVDSMLRNAKDLERRRLGTICMSIVAILLLSHRRLNYDSLVVMAFESIGCLFFLLPS